MASGVIGKTGETAAKNAALVFSYARVRSPFMLSLVASQLRVPRRKNNIAKSSLAQLNASSATGETKEIVISNVVEVCNCRSVISLPMLHMVQLHAQAKRG
jgi:hypothetical protein